MNLLDHLQASGLNPVIVDENTNFEELFVARKTKHETNVEFVTRIMEYGCPTGPLVQPFIIEAISRYARECSVTPLPDNGLIDPEAWMETAHFLLSELEKKYG